MGGKAEAGTLYVVSTPIGNLEDITRRAVRILSEVDLIAAEDTRKTGLLLKHLAIRKRIISYHNYNEAARAVSLIGSLSSGESVALVTDAGTPGISDPAFAVIRAAIDAGIPVVPVPGPTAFVPALVMSGLPTERFVFEGFLPVKKGRRKRLQALATEQRTMVLYESPHRIGRLLADLLETLGDRDAVLVRELTKKFEESIRGPLSRILDRVTSRKVKGELVLVISSVPAGLPDGNTEISADGEVSSND